MGDVIFVVRLQGKFEVDHSWEKKGSKCNCRGNDALPASLRPLLDTHNRKHYGKI